MKFILFLFSKFAKENNVNLKINNLVKKSILFKDWSISSANKMEKCFLKFQSKRPLLVTIKPSKLIHLDEPFIHSPSHHYPEAHQAVNSTQSWWVSNERKKITLKQLVQNQQPNQLLQLPPTFALFIKIESTKSIRIVARVRERRVRCNLVSWPCFELSRWCWFSQNC